METIKVINYIIMVIFFACYAYQFVYIPVALLLKDKPLPEGKTHSFAVLIAARNEQAVIAEPIDSLRQQSYPAELIDIYVVADNCTDRTAEISRQHGATVFERVNKTQVGKGYALNFLLKHIELPYDAYIVFDADNVVDPNFVREINKTFSAGYDIVTSYRNSKNYGDNWISAGYALWFLREAQYLNRPRALLGSSCGVSGTGFMFSSRILEKCGGWNFFLLTEDIEFTAHNIVNGEKVGYCPTAVFILGLITTISEWKKIRCTTGRKLLAVVTFPLFMLTYLPVTFAAIVTKPGWAPITHTKSVSVQELVCASDERSV